MDETTKREATSTTASPQSDVKNVQPNIKQLLIEKQQATTENPLNVYSTTNSYTSPRYAYVYR